MCVQSAAVVQTQNASLALCRRQNPFCNSANLRAVELLENAYCVVKLSRKKRRSIVAHCSLLIVTQKYVLRPPRFNFELQHWQRLMIDRSRVFRELRLV